MISIEKKILVSTPNQSQNQNFVILVYQHDTHGSLGLSLNCILPKEFLFNLINTLNIKYSDPNILTRIHYGGMHALNQGMILHSSDYKTSSSLPITKDLCLTNSLSLLKKIIVNEGPKKATVILGHTKFAPGQIEDELYENKWLVLEPTPDVIFTESIWNNALYCKGLTPHSQIHSYTGHA